jgi:hypothetical protein
MVVVLGTMFNRPATDLRPVFTSDRCTLLRQQRVQGAVTPAKI